MLLCLWVWRVVQYRFCFNWITDSFLVLLSSPRLLIRKWHLMLKLGLRLFITCHQRMNITNPLFMLYLCIRNKTLQGFMLFWISVFVIKHYKALCYFQKHHSSWDALIGMIKQEQWKFKPCVHGLSVNEHCHFKKDPYPISRYYGWHLYRDSADSVRGICVWAQH